MRIGAYHDSQLFENNNPVDHVENQKDNRKRNSWHLLHFFALVSLSCPNKGGHRCELQKWDEDKNCANDHPNVKQCHIGHSWNIASHGTKHSCHGKERGHSKRHSTYNHRNKVINKLLSEKQVKLWFYKLPPAGLAGVNPRGCAEKFIKEQY